MLRALSCARSLTQRGLSTLLTLRWRGGKELRCGRYPVYWSILHIAYISYKNYSALFFYLQFALCALALGFAFLLLTSEWPRMRRTSEKPKYKTPEYSFLLLLIRTREFRGRSDDDHGRRSRVLSAVGDQSYDHGARRRPGVLSTMG